MKSLFFLFITAPLILIGCGSTNSKTGNMNDVSDSDITGVFWVLETLEGETIVHPNDPREIGFRIEEDKVSGFAGCNNFMGSFSQSEANKIQFSSMASTKMACLTTTFDERIFIRAFDTIDEYELSDDGLKLMSKGNVLATFKKSSKEDHPIVEKYWKLKTLEGKEVKPLEDQEREIYFMLKGHENRVTGYAGCNSFSGNYTLTSDNTIEFSQLRSTLRVCPDADFNESEFLQVFHGPTEYKVDGDALTLFKNEAALATFEAIHFD